MPARRLKQFLDSKNIRYETISHLPANSALETAGRAHVADREMAKTVMVLVDGQMAMAVLPATHDVDLEQLCGLAGAESVELADERAFRDRFPDCELGAMPPFGNLYDMPVYVADKLAQDDQIAFNAGNHSELIQVAYSDFEDLAKPTIGTFASPL